MASSPAPIHRSEVLRTWRRREGHTVRTRLTGAWANRWVILQTGVAAGLAWVVAGNLLGHGAAFYAPIAAVIVLGGSAGQQFRRTVEMVVGATVGIVAADILVGLLGTGPAQLTVLVMLVCAVVMIFGGGRASINQAAGTVVLIIALHPPSGGIYYQRWIDVLVGAAVAVAVRAFLLPIHPMRTVRAATSGVLAPLAAAFEDGAGALRGAGEDLMPARGEALRAARGVSGLTSSAAAIQEAIAISPVYGATRAHLTGLQHALPHVGQLVDATVALLDRGDAQLSTDVRPSARPIAGLPDALDSLLFATRGLASQLAEQPGPGVEATRQAAIRAAAGVAPVHAVGSVDETSARVSEIAFHLLRATGLDAEHASAATKRS